MSTRLRFASLWLSQTVRALADNCLRMFVLLEVASGGQKASESAWYQVTVFFIAPFIVLAPVNGALSNSLPKRWVLISSAAFGVVVTAVFGLILGNEANPWIWCVGLLLVMLGSAVYSPARSALLPAVAQDTHVPLPRVNGWIEMGGAIGVVAGLVAGVYLHDHSWSFAVPLAVVATAGLYLIATLAALPVQFISDVCRPEPPVQAVLGFFRDSGRIARDAEARGSLLGLVSFLALIVAGAGAVLHYQGGLKLDGDRGPLVQALIYVMVGAAAGSLLAGLQGNLRRAMGLVPFGATGVLCALAWAATSDPTALQWPSVALGVMTGFVNVPLRATYLAVVPADARGNSMAVLNTAYYLLASLLSALLFALVHLKVLTPARQLWLLALLAAAGAALAWRLLYREQRRTTRGHGAFRHEPGQGTRSWSRQFADAWSATSHCQSCILVGRVLDRQVRAPAHVPADVEHVLRSPRAALADDLRDPRHPSTGR